jgi:hypothetical protein
LPFTVFLRFFAFFDLQIVGNICNMACGDPVVTPNAAAVAVDAPAVPTEGGEEGEAASAEAIARMGAEAALRHLATHFGAALLEALPRLWECMAGALLTGPQSDPQSLVNNLQVRSVWHHATKLTLSQHFYFLCLLAFNCLALSRIVCNQI